MGYTHYWYKEKEIEQTTFNKIVNDFKEIVPMLKVLDIPLANGNGEGEPELTDQIVCFNGKHYCHHPKNSNIVLPWPLMDPKAGVAPTGSKALSGSWWAE